MYFNRLCRETCPLSRRYCRNHCHLHVLRLSFSHVSASLSPAMALRSHRVACSPGRMKLARSPLLAGRRALSTGGGAPSVDVPNDQRPVAARDFSFSGSGFLLSFHLGVAHELQRAGAIQPSSRFAGASGGAIAALTLAADVEVEQIHAEAKRMAALCRAQGTLWKLEDRLRDIFAQRFSGVAVDKLERRLTIATEKMWPARLMVLSDRFDSLEDLGDALIASCYIPFYLAPRGTSLFRGEHHVDGGLLTLVPEIPDYVKVCAFPATTLRRPDYEISPSIDPQFPFSVFQLFRFALFPPEPKVLDELFELGARCARLWVEQQKERKDSAEV